MYHTRAMWRPRTDSKKYITYISTNFEDDNLIQQEVVNDEQEIINDEQTVINDEQETNYVVIKANNNIISKYGIVEDYRECNVLSSRRSDLRGHPLTMANVITDSNDTRIHLDDRL